MIQTQSSLNKLITGIPRSGTTLCCNLLNQCDNTLALHEPIDPQKLTSTEPHLAVQALTQQISMLRQSLESNRPIEHGDKAGIALDNPVGNKANEKGLRSLKASRGKITLPAIDKSTQLFVKQNALFTALAMELKRQYSVIAIVRNPVDVLLSWMTVDLPVNRGRLPAGEKFDPELAKKLTIGNVFERQIAIYRWFIEKFKQAHLCQVRYEDIIESNGQALYSAVGITYTTSLNSVERTFSASTISQIEANWPSILSLGLEASYSEVFLDKRFTQLLSSV